MEEKKQARTRIVPFRLLPDEYGKLESAWKKTTIKKLSEYLRRLIFNKPVTGYVRNQSLDEFMAEMVLLRKELNAIGVNFNQAVHRLHTLDHLPQMQLWLKGFERDKEVLFGKVEEIKSRINLFSDQWLQ
ncbi:MAG: plasmid mobilization relaxosome protein MobC [Bacteroidota bacterium]|nr:plasmid mobilization relaxosome protein MobC [Bacteroidota bacterium]